MGHPGQQHPALLLRGPGHLQGAGVGQRDRLLHQHVGVGGEGGENMGLVEVIRRGDQQGVHLGVGEEVFDVVEHVPDGEPLRERPRLGQVDVADGGELDVLELLEHREVRHLHDDAGSDQADANGIAHGAHPCSVGAGNRGARKIRREDVLVGKAGAGAADRAPLAHPHAVPGPRADRVETDDPAPVPGHLQVEVGAPQNAAVRRAEDQAGHRAGHHEAAAGARELEPCDPPGGRAVQHAHVAQPVGELGGSARGGERLPERAGERLAGPALLPAEAGRDGAPRVAPGVLVAEGAEIGTVRTREDFDAVGGAAAAR